MTYADRELIFSKDYITTQELADLLGIAYTKSQHIITADKTQNRR